MEQEYVHVWFRGGDLNGFWDIWPFMKWRGEACSRGSPSWCHWMCLILTNKNIYGLGAGSEQFLGYMAFYEVEGRGPFETLLLNFILISIISLKFQKSVERLLRTCPEKIWADFRMPPGDILGPGFWILKSQISEQSVHLLLRTLPDIYGPKKNNNNKNNKKKRTPGILWNPIA